ncbi:MAG: DNA methyltransferase [Bacillota bacterium]
MKLLVSRSREGNACPFGDLDEATDGVLIEGENYQALRLLRAGYCGQVKCVYIDPPYNNGRGDVVPKGGYSHATWLTMMEERLKLAGELFAPDGVNFVSIDDSEGNHLIELLEEVFDHLIGKFVWHKKAQPSYLFREILAVTECTLAATKMKVQDTVKGVTPPSC